MSTREDPELEDRLRRMAPGPAQDAPASLYKYMNELARGTERRVAGVAVSPVRPVRRGSFGFRTAGAALGLAAVLLIVLAGTGLILGTTGPRPAATWQPRTDVGQGQWTGLEWHDVTATASGLAGQGYYVWSNLDTGGVVRYAGGYAMVGGDLRPWLSSDGLTWKRASGAPGWPSIQAFGGELIATGVDDVTSNTVVVRSTVDGITWTPMTLQLGGASISNLVVGEPGVVVLTTAGSAPLGPWDVYFARDLKTWTHASLPADMAGSRNLQITPFIGGFVAVGQVVDTGGSETDIDASGNQTSYSYRAWRSPDGLNWTTYEPKVGESSFSSNVPPWNQIQTGRLGAGDGRIYSTDGGVTWQAQKTVVLNGDRSVSDGQRIIMSAGSGARFYLSEGDGHWSQLQQGGDVASLPAGGQPVLLANGVLWIAGNRVYFGQALSGVEPRGSVGPPTTPSPGYTPAEPIPTVQETITPEPSVAASPAAALTTTGFTTSGATSAWAGFTRAALANDDPMRADPNRLGSGVSQVLQWRGGYVATGSVTVFGQTSPSFGLWTSPDGETWTAVTSVHAAAAMVAVAPVGLIAVGMNSHETERATTAQSVWTSADGVTWHDAGTPNLAGSLVSIAGTAAGLVATVDTSAPSSPNDNLTYAIEYSTDGINWTPETVDPLLGISDPGNGLPPHVQANDGHFYLMGSPETGTSSTGFELTSSVQPADEMWLSDDGKTWTRSSGGYSMLADYIDFGRDGMLLHTTVRAVPGATGEAYSTDGGKTWHDANDAPLGAYQCQGECASGPNGVIGSNGTELVAVQYGGAKAWISYDGHTWTAIAWSGGDPSGGSMTRGGFAVMPRGVLVGSIYSAAK